DGPVSGEVQRWRPDADRCQPPQQPALPRLTFRGEAGASARGAPGKAGRDRARAARTVRGEAALTRTEYRPMPTSPASLPSSHLAARDLAEARGLRVFPIYEPNGADCTCSLGPRCASSGKHPRTLHGLKDASADLGQIDAWWRDWPDANIGVATGTVSGVVVLDVDGDAGRESLTTLAPLPDTWRSRTGRGEHVWFAHPGHAVGNRAGFRPGLDLRGDGGYVLVPPSR